MTAESKQLIIIKHSSCLLPTKRASDGLVCWLIHSGKGISFHMPACMFLENLSLEAKVLWILQNPLPLSGGSVRFGRWNRWLWHEDQLGRDLVANGGDPGRREMHDKDSDTVSVLQVCSLHPKIYDAIHLNLMIHSLMTK